MIVPLPSNPRRSDHSRARGENPCAVCGKEIAHPQWFVRIVRGGSHIATADEVVPPSEDLGMHAVGRECRKVVGKEFLVGS